MSRTIRRPILFAHKGGRAHAPENTLPAFAMALKLGATALESDVWLTADGAPVFDHDGLVRRVPIRKLNRSELPPQMVGLEDLYDACGTNFDLSLDILDPAAFDPVLSLARAAASGAVDRLWLVTEDVVQAATWRRLEPQVHLVHSTELMEMPDGPAAHAVLLRDGGIDAVNLHVRDWSADLVELFHAHGLLAFGWNAHSRKRLRQLIGYGCDAVYGDHVDLLLEMSARS